MALFFCSVLMIICCCSIWIADSLIPDALLYRKVNSSKRSILDIDDDGNCFYPPFCRLNVSKCNIDKVPFDQMNFSKYYNEYYLTQKPLIIQFCNVDKCDFSSILDESSDIFNFDDMSKMILSEEASHNLRFEEFADQRSRYDFTTIEGIDARYSPLYKLIYSAFKRPLFLEHMDLYNDLLGFLSTSSEHDLVTNNWLIFGVTSGGATFHADFYGVAFWNHLLHGSKYWVLMSPSDVLSIWNDSVAQILDVEYLPNWEWFDQIYLSGFLDSEYERIGNNEHYYHCQQQRGDFLIAPELFYHITVNLEKSLAIGQALITRQNFNNFSFGFFDANNENPHKLVDTEIAGTDYSMGKAMKLCVALSNYDYALWKESICNDETFKMQLKGHRYDSALKYAKEHSQFSDFY